MPRVLHARPSHAYVIDPEWQRLHSQDTAYVVWMECLLSLHKAGLVRVASSAVRGSEERRNPQWHGDVKMMKTPGTPEYELCVMFIGMHDDVLTAIKPFWLSLPVGVGESGEEEKIKEEEVEAIEREA